ncbi:MAG: histidinol-phosphate transaminase [Alphaproteobacteria bacterium]|nr:histidinol-phosphate transaminase [Alphaproteobacteria bacterium]
MTLPLPRPGILEIAPYVGGKSHAPGGARVIKLSSNESALGPSPAAIEAYQAQAAKLHRYPDGHANALREAIAEMQELEVARLVCGAGSDELIGLLVHAYAGEGDEVLYSEHGFLMYKIYAQSAGAVPVAAPERQLTADVDALLARVTPRTRLVFIANPNNPTGSMISAGEMARLRQGLPEHVLLVIDAAYAEYVTDANYDPGTGLVNAGENTVMLRTFSKAYGLPALRIGWGYVPPAVADVLNRIRSPFNLSSAAIAAGAAAMRDQDHLRKAVAHNTLWRGRLTESLRAMGLRVRDSEGNFVLAEFPFAGPHSAASVNAFLLSRGIIVREVGNYGLPHCLRITVGLKEENEALLAALKTALA